MMLLIVVWVIIKIWILWQCRRHTLTMFCSGTWARKLCCNILSTWRWSWLCMYWCLCLVLRRCVCVHIHLDRTAILDILWWGMISRITDCPWWVIMLIRRIHFPCYDGAISTTAIPGNNVMSMIALWFNKKVDYDVICNLRFWWLVL